MTDNNQAQTAFIANIKAIMRDREMTQSDLADLVGMNKATVSYWLSKRSMPNTNNMQALANALGVAVNDLISSDSGYASGGPSAPALRGHRPVRAVPDARVPLRRLGRVHAGEADEEYDDDGEVLVPAFVVERHPRSYAVRVNGNCMDNVIPGGYDVVLDPDMAPRDRCIAVVEIAPGEAVMRRWTATSRTLVLSCDSHTEDHEDIVLGAEDSPRVLGVVVWAQREMLERAVQGATA